MGRCRRIVFAARVSRAPKVNCIVNLQSPTHDLSSYAAAVLRGPAAVRWRLAPAHSRPTQRPSCSLLAGPRGLCRRSRAPVRRRAPGSAASASAARMRRGRRNTAPRSRRSLDACSRRFARSVRGRAAWPRGESETVVAAMLTIAGAAQSMDKLASRWRRMDDAKLIKLTARSYPSLFETAGDASSPRWLQRRRRARSRQEVHGWTTRPSSPKPHACAKHARRAAARPCRRRSRAGKPNRALPRTSSMAAAHAQAQARADAVGGRILPLEAMKPWQRDRAIERQQQLDERADRGGGAPVLRKLPREFERADMDFSAQWQKRLQRSRVEDRPSQSPHGQRKVDLRLQRVRRQQSEVARQVPTLRRLELARRNRR